MDLKQHIDFFEHEYPQDRLFVFSPVGSWNYNCADEYSDVDTKFIVVPSMTDIVNNNCDSFTHIFPNDEHCEIVDIRNFAKSIKKGNPQFLEILFSNYIEYNSEFFGEEVNILLQNREEISRCNTPNTMRAFLGMADRNHQLCKIRGSEDHANKWLYQLVRIEECMKKFFQGSTFEDCLVTTQRDRLLEIKNNHYTTEKIMSIADSSIENCRLYYENYKLCPSYYEVRWVQCWIDEVIKSVIKKYITK